jgi:hypothetical protein
MEFYKKNLFLAAITGILSVLFMNNKKINTNTIDLNAKETKEMAKVLLSNAKVA